MKTHLSRAFQSSLLQTVTSDSRLDLVYLLALGRWSETPKRSLCALLTILHSLVWKVQKYFKLKYVLCLVQKKKENKMEKWYGTVLTFANKGDEVFCSGRHYRLVHCRTACVR